MRHKIHYQQFISGHKTNKQVAWEIKHTVQSTRLLRLINIRSPGTRCKLFFRTQIVEMMIKSQGAQGALQQAYWEKNAFSKGSRELTITIKKFFKRKSHD